VSERSKRAPADRSEIWAGSVPAPDLDEPVFSAPWEAQAFAMAVALQARGWFTAAEWADALGAEIARSDPTATYYEQWLASLEGLLAAKGLADPATLEGYRRGWARAAARTPHGSPIELTHGDL
jgi:nitrile hydratase accessory protein